MHALIIDDSKAMRSILRRILNNNGFETSEAGDGREAPSAMLDGMDTPQRRI